MAKAASVSDSARPEKHAGGRPSEYSHTRVTPILRLIRLGNAEQTSVESAAVCAWNTYKAWRARYPEFLTEIKKARADALVAARAKVRAGKQGWQSGAWELERMDPENWRKVEEVEIPKGLKMILEWKDAPNGGTPKNN